VIPELRPYRSRGEIGSWVRDETLIPTCKDRLSKYKYAGIGEFHLYGADADLPVVRRMVELAKKHNLFLHAHSDVDAIERLFRQWPQARILWAHSGFERPERVAEMLKKHKNLWCDLAFRTDHASGGKVDPAWRTVFVQFARPLHGRHRQLRSRALALHPRARRLVAALALGPAARTSPSASHGKIGEEALQASLLQRRISSRAARAPASPRSWARDSKSPRFVLGFSSPMPSRFPSTAPRHCHLREIPLPNPKV
jgi:hypothetical protein